MIAAIRRIAIALVSISPSLAISACAVIGPSDVRIRPAPQSPIATDGPNIYAVGADRQTVLISRPGNNEWRRVALVPGADIRGLAWANGHLFFTSTADASLQFVPTGVREREQGPVVIHRGAPFVTPGELTNAGSLVVADAGAGSLFRVPLAKRPAGYAAAAAPTPLRTDIPISDGTFLSGWGSGEVMISDGESGFLGQLTEFVAGGDAKLRTMQTKKPGDDAPVAWNQRAGYAETVRRTGYPGVNYPGPIATYNGILYVVDARSSKLFAAGIHDARAIRIPMPDTQITRLAANPIMLTAMDSDGRLHTWPRVVPSELTLLPAARPQSLFPVLQYLYQRKLIETREVVVSGTLDDTLDRARMSWPARGKELEPETEEGRYASFCLFNPRLCTNGLPNRELEQGETITLASLYAERFTIATQVTLNGSQTLGEAVDEAIKSPEFKHLTTDAYLRRVNGLPESADAPAPRELATGTYRIAQERARYVIPIEAVELRQGTEYQRLVERVKGTLRIAPLERVLTSASSAEAPQSADATAALAQSAFTALIEAINYAPATPTRTIYVGVAEEKIDTKHPDFVDPKGVEVLEEFGVDPADAVASPAVPPSETAAAPPPAVSPVAAGSACPEPKPAPPGGPPITWRCFHDSDHGTAVASIIGGRTRADREGFAFTRAIIGMLSRPRVTEVLASDIERALQKVLMTVVNLSLQSQKASDKLRITIEQHQDDALFVISAPKSTARVTLCKGQADWYPACYGKRFKNVLVVGGTTLDTKNIYEASPVGPDVHLFAPGDQYYSAGRYNSYVRIGGTSFATALVSAAAAMLSSMGETSPELIKQRLIATAKVMTLPDRPEWARVLDVKKATTYVRHSVFTDAGTKTEQPVMVLNRNASVRLTTLENQPLDMAIGHIRRLKRVEQEPTKFDLAYIVAGTGQLDLKTVRAPHADERERCKRENRPCEVWEVKYKPLNPQGLVIGPEATMDLTELFDYVGPIAFR